MAVLSISHTPSGADDTSVFLTGREAEPPGLRGEDSRGDPGATPGAEEPGHGDMLREFFFPDGNLEGRGLLNLRDPFPLALLHLQLPVNTLQVLDEGESEIQLNFHWGNSFAVDDTFEVDTETYQVELSGWYAVKADFYLGAGLGLHARDSGVLDPLVDSFHDVFRLGSGDRETRPRNAHEISVVDDDGSRHSLERGVGIGDLVLKAHWLLNRGGHFFPAVAVEGFVSLPTSTSGFGSNGVDTGILLSYYKRVLDRVFLYGMLGGTYTTSPQVEGFRFEKVGYQATGGLEIAVIDDLSLLFQAMVYSPLLASPDPLDDGRNYLAGGLKWEFVSDCQLELSFIENLAPFRNSADLAFVAGFDFAF